MPYVLPDFRSDLDLVVDCMIDKRVAPDGKLNYVLYKFCKDTVEPSYRNYRDYVAELRACATEIERRIIGPYEDEKIAENGDVE